MARSVRKESRILRETAALFFIFFALFLLLCLVSYLLPLLKPGQGLQEPAANWCGSIGFFSAHYLFSFLGLAAFFAVGILCYVSGAFLFSWSELNRIPYVVVGITGTLLSSAGLLGMSGAWGGIGQYITPGGFVGVFLWTALSGAVGNVGSILLLTLVLVLSLMAAVRFSLLGTMHWSWKRSLGLFLSLCTYLKKAVTRKGPVEKQQPVSVAKNLPPIAPAPPAVHEPVLCEPEKLEEEKGFSLKPIKAGQYRLPSVSLLNENTQENVKVSREYYLEISKVLADKLLDFGVEGVVVGISPGPVVTTYEYAPAPGVKINKIVALADDLAMVLKVDRVRIVGSIPGKAAIGIEIPNPSRKMVFLRDILLSKEYRASKSMLTLALGYDVVGRSVVADLSKMPHLLIAGATGAGKSVAINAFIASILYKATPEEVRLLMIDPKRIELSVYDDIPHLLHPVVVEAKMASRALIWAVREMERRYRLLEEKRVKSFYTYNQVAEEKLPYIVIIVDELADLMMVASKDVETSIARLAQMARAAGMHIVLATQRPSVDVLTGLIKANFPTRISFKVSSKVDSRTVLDGSGAEHLLGMGDMLFLPPGAAKLQRIHGAFISEQETERIIHFLKEQGKAEYDDTVLKSVEDESNGNDTSSEEYDEKYDEAVAVVTETGQASISMVQRRLRVGYNRAARMIETMEREGIVGPADGSRPREVLARSDYSEM
ncbi:DNA translocase FtsK 4TM domain-containing protein [Desulfogranum marinum]|uniref:DNA translocase FtsK n=1 Tax=Desulfogranum marinum TaxID=453220 RepID=UPI0029C993DF|nr:DNA translocase FtsK 4TM domain-containing protein [Desulfogranum marinum]